MLYKIMLLCCLSAFSLTSHAMMLMGDLVAMYNQDSFSSLDKIDIPPNPYHQAALTYEFAQLKLQREKQEALEELEKRKKQEIAQAIFTQQKLALQQERSEAQIHIYKRSKVSEAQWNAHAGCRHVPHSRRRAGLRAPLQR